MADHSGFKLLGDIDADAKKIKNLGAPTDPADAFRLRDILVADITVNNVSSYLISGLNGNADGVYRFIVEGYEHTTNGGINYVPCIRPNSDPTEARYANTLHWSNSTNQGVGGITGVGLVIADDGVSSNGLFVTGMIRAAVRAGKPRLCQAWSSSYSATSPTMTQHTGIWNDTVTNITSLLFVFPNNFTGRIILFRR